ncbi:peptidoglycan editing factor PgeF [Gorillibacterium timonense]|uniref:peptidoglycan editing factor PgeF n=1 Tax=Gorillibacterium timonense TaxID=1689269 RepID=UPI00071C817A|nr:peptidoglycan editing factor PgeF [Gorillibacterium timonense]
MESFQYEAEAEGPGLFRVKSWMDRYPQLTLGMTSRIGGKSREPFGTLNCGLHVGDLPADVTANRTAVAQALNSDLDHWVYGEQVHGSTVALVGPTDRGRGTRERETELRATDAFITNTPGIVLAALFADCVPLYFFDPVTGSIGLAHAGWKGTAACIAAKTIEAMEHEFGSSPSDIQAAIGPSIGKCCYEVDDGVIGPIREALAGPDGDLCGEESDRYYTAIGSGKYKLDLQQVNRQIMIKAGIFPASIEVTGRCTSCTTDLLYSYRREGGQTGRMQAWIGLKPSGRPSSEGYEGSC